MGIVFRQSVKTTIVTFTGAALGALIQFISVYVFTQREFGFYKSSISLAAVLQLFLMMGMGSVLAVFIQKYPERDPRKKTLVTISVLLTAIASLIYTASFIIFRQNFVELYKPQDRPLLDKYYYYIPVMVTLWGFMSLFELYLSSQFRIAFSAFAKEVLLRLCNLGIIALYYYRLIDFNYFIIFSLLVYAVPAALLFLASSRTKGFGFSLDFSVFTRAEYAEIGKFAWYHLLLGFSQNLFGYMDTIMLGQLDRTGFESVAIYITAVFVISVMVIPYRAMANSAFPILNKTYIEEDHEHLSDLFKRSGVNILIVGMALFAVIFCNLDNLVAILPKGYEAIKPILTILMIGKIIDMTTGLNSELISISKYYKFNFRSSASLIVLLYFTYRLLIPVYGIYGAAWGTTLAFTAYNVAKMLFLWFKMRLHPFTRGTLQVVFATAVTVFIGYVIPNVISLAMHPIIQSILDAAIRSIVILAVYGGLLFWLKPSEDLRNYLASIKKSRRLF